MLNTITRWSALSAVAVLTIFGFVQKPAYSQTYVTFDDPLGVGSTRASGISGSSIVGSYVDSNGLSHGFAYNGTSFITLDDPLGVGGTQANGISGSEIVGSFVDSGGVVHGFSYNGTTYTTLDDPLAAASSSTGTWAEGVSAGNIVGYYTDSNSSTHGFVYNGSTYTTLDDPAGLGSTQAFGITGSSIVGSYVDNTGLTNGFSYDGTTFTTLDDPLGTDFASPGGTVALGINGVSIVGSYTNIYGYTQGFLYNDANYTTLIVPGEAEFGFGSCAAAGISGSNIVGYFTDNSNYRHGFLYSQEPPTPAGLSATAGNAEAVLKWTASAGATSYSLYVGTTAGGEKSTPFATGVKSTHYTNTHLTNGKTYYYRIAAVNSGGTSAYSNEASATPEAPPTVPTTLSATAGNAEVTLNWTASAGATSYDLYSGTASGGEKAKPFAIGVKSTHYKNTHLTNGVTYYYKVVAANAVGTSGYSSEASAAPVMAAASASLTPSYPFASAFRLSERIDSIGVLKKENTIYQCNFNRGTHVHTPRQSN